MEDLVRYYERELALLREQAREFAERYPKIATRLVLRGDSASEDPHAERLFETFALLAARAAKNIEDDYPEFTKALIGTLYPHYLRPFPSCAIACFDVDSSRAAQMSSSVTIPRGTELYSRPVRGTKVFFRTAYDVTLSPLQLTGARFHAIAQVPSLSRAPAGASAQISLTFAIQSGHASAAELQLDSVRLYTQGEPQFTAALRDALSMRALCAYVEPGQSGRWIALDRFPFAAAGMTRTDALVPYPETSDPAYLLLSEYFAYPEKFGFFDCDLRQAGRLGGRQFTLHVLLKDILADSAEARILQSLATEHVLLGCTPVVNLFETTGKLSDQASASSTEAAYPLVVDEQVAHAYEVYSVDSVTQTKQTAQGDKVAVFDPLYSLRHSLRPTRDTIYWKLHRDDLAARNSPGLEVALSFVNGDLEVAPPPNALDCKLTCSNRDLPAHLDYGLPGGDLTLEGGTLARRISLLHRPTRSIRFRHGHNALWRLISQLSLNPVLLTGGAEPIRDLLKLHDLQGSAISVRQIEGVVNLTQKVVTAWVPSQPFAGMVRGIEIHLTVDPDCFAGTGVHVFAKVMDELVSLYVTSNSFTQLVLLSSKDGEELLRCPRRTGSAFLT